MLMFQEVLVEGVSMKRNYVNLYVPLVLFKKQFNYFKSTAQWLEKSA
jgi:hypothetical protein